MNFFKNYKIKKRRKRFRNDLIELVSQRWPHLLRKMARHQNAWMIERFGRHIEELMVMEADYTFIRENILRREALEAFNRNLPTMTVDEISGAIERHLEAYKSAIKRLRQRRTSQDSSKGFGNVGE